MPTGDTIAESAHKQWADIIRRQGEESARKQDERVAKMQEELPTKIEELKTMGNAALVDYTILSAQQSCFDPRETKVWQDLATAGREELLRRLGMDDEGPKE